MLRAISNWQLLIRTMCVQLLFRVAVFLAAGSRRQSRHALTYVRRIGAIGLLMPNVKRPATHFVRSSARVLRLAGREGVAPRQNTPEH
jgi:hypothetical protein